MAATTSSVKTDAIQTDKMKFRTQLVDGKPQIFFDTIDDSSSNKSKGKRASRTLNNTQTNRIVEQQKTKGNNQKLLTDYGPNQRMMKTQQPTDRGRTNDDGSNLGVYMTMDELSELVKAVKENAKNQNNTNTNTKDPPLATPPSHYQEPQHYESAPVPPVPKLDLQSTALPPTTSAGVISPREQTMSIIADKKRQKWFREKAEIERMKLEIEYDQLKHQLSPRHKNTSVSPERSTFQYDFPATVKPPPVPAAIKPNDYQHTIPLKINEESPDEPAKTRLMERKQQQWKQESADKMPTWNPFGRPGAGAPNPNDMTARPSQTPADVAVAAPYRALVPPATAYKADHTSLPVPPSFIHNDQTNVPAAMRTNLLFGDVRFEDDVKTAKEIDRRQWLDDLQKQVEANKRKKFAPYETGRRQDFLHENVQPLLQEAANRHQQQKDTGPNHAGQDLNRFNRHEPVIQQATDTDTKSAVNQRTGEKLFGPNYETSSQPATTNRIDASHLNVGQDRQHPYRPSDVRRDEAVNTVGTTFRSDHTSHSDHRASPNKQPYAYAYEESDLPPHAPNHRHQNGQQRNIPTQQQTKRNTRMRSFEDNNQTRRASAATFQSNAHVDGATSQMSGQRDAQHRPLWNYKNPAHREYVSNSKRDPHYEKRQRLKHFEQGNFDRIDDVQKKTCYNRWNSDSELQQHQKPSVPTNRIRSTASKPTSFGHNKDESILNLLKGRNRQPETFGNMKTPSNPMRTDDEYNNNRESSLDRYENYATNEGRDPVNDYSPVSRSRESSAPKQMTETNTFEDSQQRTWENINRPETFAPPASRQEHILQQLSTIKENLVRRQRELASTSNIIPV